MLSTRQRCITITLDVALAGNYVAKPSNGWYCHVDKETGELLDPKVRAKDTLTKEFWEPIMTGTDFKKFIKGHYQIGHKPLLEVELDLTDE